MFILDVEQKHANFDARGDCTSRTYVYMIATPDQKEDKHAGFRQDWMFNRHNLWAIDDVLDVSAMQKASLHLLGEQDFASLQGSGANATITTMRCVMDIRVERRLMGSSNVAESVNMLFPSRGSLVTITITANSFLYHMVRNIVGILVDIGRGKMEGTEIPGMLAMRNRDRLKSPTAPACGLYLRDVHYDPEGLTGRERSMITAMEMTRHGGT